MAAGFHEYGALEIQLQLAEGVPGSGSEEFWTSLLQELKAFSEGSQHFWVAKKEAWVDGSHTDLTHWLSNLGSTSCDSRGPGKTSCLT